MHAKKLNKSSGEEYENDDCINELILLCCRKGHMTGVSDYKTETGRHHTKKSNK